MNEVNETWQIRKMRASLPYLALTAAVFAAYANVYSNGFVFDDRAIIVDNTFLRHWSSFSDLMTGLMPGAKESAFFYRPLPLALYFVIYQMFGLSAAAFHGFNVVLHAVNTGLMYTLGKRLRLLPTASFIAALLWAVHPLHTESVAYASSTPELLYSGLCLAGILVLLPDFAPRKVWLASLFLVVAIICKESAVVFPALATFTLFLISKERLQARTYIRTWPLWLFSIAYIVAWNMCPHLGKFLFHDPQDMFYDQFYTHNIINRLLTSLATLPTYLKLIVWPACLHMEWTFPVFTRVWSGPVLAGMAIAGASALLIICGYRKQGLFAMIWGLLWFAAAQSPNTGIIKPLYGLIGEHWMYLPTIGLFLGTTHTIDTWINGLKPGKVPLVAAALAVIAAISLGTKTWMQNKVWHDPVSLYEHALHCGSESGRVHNNLGMFYFQQGAYTEAAEQFRSVIAHPAPMWLSMTSSVRLHLAFIYLGVVPDKDGIVTPEGIAQALPSAPHLPEAIAELKKAQEVAPANDPDAYWADRFLSVIDAKKPGPR
jgi:hypothetical protein